MIRVALPLILIAAYGFPNLANAVDQTKFVNDVVKVKQIVQLLHTMSRKVSHEREQENTLYKEINHYCTARQQKVAVAPQAHAAPVAPHTQAAPAVLKKAVAEVKAVVKPVVKQAKTDPSQGADELADEASAVSDDSVDEPTIPDTSSTDDQDAGDVSSVDAAEAAAEELVEQDVAPGKDAKGVSHQKQPIQIPKKAAHLAPAPVMHSAAQINAAVSAALDDVATNVPDAVSKKTAQVAQVQAAGDPDEELQEVQVMLKATSTSVAEEPALSRSHVSTQPQKLKQALDDLATNMPGAPMTSKKIEHVAKAQAAADPDEELKEVQAMVKDTGASVAEVPSVPVSHVNTQPKKLKQAQKENKVQQKQKKMPSTLEKTLPPKVVSHNLRQKVEAVFGDDGHVEAADDDANVQTSDENNDPEVA